MKILTTLLILFFIYGCKNTDPTGAYLTKKAIQKNSSYFISDSCYKGNEYAKYQFLDESYQKTIYSDSDLNSVDSVIEDKIDYIEFNRLRFYVNNRRSEECSFIKDSNISATFTCHSLESNSTYNITKTLWTTKEMALENRDYDCNKTPK